MTTTKEAKSSPSCEEGTRTPPATPPPASPSTPSKKRNRSILQQLDAPSDDDEWKPSDSDVVNEGDGEDEEYKPAKSPKTPKSPKSPTSKSKTSTPKKAKAEGTSSAAGSPGRSSGWTPQQRLAIFDAVVAGANASTFESVAAEIGKTRSQAYDNWRKVIYPKLRKDVQNI